MQNENVAGQIINVKDKSPKILIRNVTNYVSESDFVEKIKLQNSEIREKIENGSEFSVVFSREQAKSQHTPHIEKGDRIGYQLVLRVSEEIRRIIKTNGDRIFMGFNSHRVFDRFYVKSCVKCHRFGHYHAECTSKSKIMFQNSAMFIMRRKIQVSTNV